MSLGDLDGNLPQDIERVHVRERDHTMNTSGVLFGDTPIDANVLTASPESPAGDLRLFRSPLPITMRAFSHHARVLPEKDMSAMGANHRFRESAIRPRRTVPWKTRHFMPGTFRRRRRYIVIRREDALCGARISIISFRHKHASSRQKIAQNNY